MTTNRRDRNMEQASRGAPSNKGMKRHSGRLPRSQDNVWLIVELKDVRPE